MLGPRQLGKSSLRLRLSSALAARGLRVASLDLAGMGGAKDADGWLHAIAEELALELGDETLETLTSPPPGAGRFRYLSRLLQRASEAGPWVLFIDELDALAASPEAADAVLGALRAAWDAANDGSGQRPFRLCLSGVVAPFELGADPNRTPFNVSRPILLTDFTEEEAAGLGQGFDPSARAVLLAEIYRWTQGHPYMSHRLAERVAAGDGEGPAGPRVEGLVRRLFLDGGVHGDANLAGAARRLAAGGDDLPEMLALYRRALLEGGVEADGRRAATVRLLLTGLAVWRATARGPRLCVRNPIYAAVFDGAWVAEQLDRRPFSAAYETWIRADRAADGLLRGEVLARAQSWAEGRADLSQDEVSFLLRSAEAWRASEAARAELEQRRLSDALAEEQRRRTRQRSIVLAALAVLAVLAAVVGIYFNIKLLESEQKAIEAQHRAESEAQITRSANAGLLVETANTALARGDLSSAEVSAAAALALAERPVARGILMRLAASPRPSLAWQVALRSGARVLRPLVGERDVIAPDGPDLVALDVDTGALRWRLPGLGNSGRALGPDLRTLYGQAGVGAPLERLDLTTGVRTVVAPFPELLVDAVVSPDGATLFAMTDAYQFLAVRLSDGARLWSRPTPKPSVHRLTLSPDGAEVAAGSTQGVIVVLDSHTGQVRYSKLGVPPAGYAHLWLGPGQWLIGGRGEGSDGHLYRWSARGLVDALAGLTPPRWGVVRARSWASLESDGMARADASLGWVGLTDGSVLAVVDGAQPLLRFRAAEAQIRPAARGTRLFTLDASQEVLKAWTLPALPAPAPTVSPVSRISLDVNASGVLLVNGQGEVERRDPRSGAVISTLAGPPGRGLGCVVERGGRLAGADGTGTLWRRSAEGWSALPVHGGGLGPRSVLASDDGRVTLMATQGPPSLLLVDEALTEIPCGTSADVAALTRDGDRMALGCAGHEEGGAEPVRIYDTRDGRQVAELHPPEGDPNALAWLDDGQTLLVGTRDGSVLRWSGGSDLQPWVAFVGQVLDLEVSDDGAWVAGAGTSGLVRIWSSDGALVAELSALSPAPSRLRFGPHHLVVRLADGAVVAWPLDLLTADPAALVRQAEARWGARIVDGQWSWTPASALGL